MNIVIFGPRGAIGSAIANEAIARGHQVIGVIRGMPVEPNPTARLRLVTGDALDTTSVATVAHGADAVVCAIAPRPTDGPQAMVNAIRSLIAGLTRVGTTRLLVVGGAGSLRVAPHKELVDTPEFPAEWKDVALAHRDALRVLQSEGSALEWTYFSPAGLISSGKRTGVFRLGSDQLVVDAAGKSAISIEDYAVALVDEIEKGAHKRQQMTIGY